MTEQTISYHGGRRCHAKRLQLVDRGRTRQVYLIIEAIVTEVSCLSSWIGTVAISCVAVAAVIVVTVVTVTVVHDG